MYILQSSAGVWAKFGVEQYVRRAKPSHYKNLCFYVRDIQYIYIDDICLALFVFRQPLSLTNPLNLESMAMA